MKSNKYLQDALFLESQSDGSPQELVPRGLLSSTTLACQIGAVSSNTWIGEEGAVLKKPLNYTVTAKGPVCALQTRVSDLALLPSDCLSELVKKTKGKIMWISERLFQLSETNANMLNEDMSNRIYQKSIARIQERFPQANASALLHLRRVVLKDDPISPSTLHRIDRARYSVNYKRSLNASLPDAAPLSEGSYSPTISAKPILGGRLIKLVPLTISRRRWERQGGEEETQKMLRLVQASTIRGERRRELVPIAPDRRAETKDPACVLPEIIKRYGRKNGQPRSRRACSFMG